MCCDSVGESFLQASKMRVRSIAVYYMCMCFEGVVQGLYFDVQAKSGESWLVNMEGTVLLGIEISKY